MTKTSQLTDQICTKLGLTGKKRERVFADLYTASKQGEEDLEMAVGRYMGMNLDEIDKIFGK